MAEATAVDTSVDAPIYLESFERQKSAIRAVPTDDLLTVNVEPLLALQAMHRALPRVSAMRARLVEEFKSFDRAKFDNLRDYGYAFAHATTLLRAAEPQVSGFDQLANECSEMRSKLDAYLRAAIEAGVLSTSRLSELKGTVGHRNTAHDLLLLAQIYRANWSKLEGKTFFTQADIRHADALAARLNAAAAERDAKPGSYDEVSLDRQRAFTLFITAYDYVRRRVRVLLEEDGQDDALDDIMPSLRNNRASGKKRTEAAESPANAAPAAPANGAVARSTLQPLAGTGGRVGMPDSDPFTSQ